MNDLYHAYGSDHGGDSSVASTITEESLDGETEAEKKLKKSVRFNEVVQRQIYRSNSSILGQKHKNQKKAEQKRRKAARRASEGDMPSSSPDFDTHKNAESNDEDHTNDSGVASSYDESLKVQQQVKSKKKSKKSNSKNMDNESADLIFNLDF